MGLQRIVIGVDFSPASADAARFAAQLFRRDAELILVHAVSGSERADADGRLQHLRDSMQAESINVEIREGDPARALYDVSRDRNADLIVVGARGERAGLGRALGTTAQHVVRESAIPVLVVARPGEQSISQILVPVDDDAAAQASLRSAAALSKRFDARVTILHVTTTGIARQMASQEGIPSDDSRRSAASGDVSDNSRWIELARASGIARERMSIEESSGVPAAEITSAAERSSADIIVMGRRSARNLRRAVLGSVTATMLGNPPCNVLVVPET